MAIDQFQKELTLVQNAALRHADMALLIDYLKPFVTPIAQQYARDGRWQDLRPVSWRHLDRAVNNYLERLESPRHQAPTFLFSTYFAWYARQAIVEFLSRHEPHHASR